MNKNITQKRHTSECDSAGTAKSVMTTGLTDDSTTDYPKIFPFSAHHGHAYILVSKCPCCSGSMKLKQRSADACGQSVNCLLVVWG